MAPPIVNGPCVDDSLPRASQAIARDDGSWMRSLLKAGLDPASRLHGLGLAYAALGSPQCFQALIEAGAPLDDRGGPMAPLVFCAAHGDYRQSLQALLRWGASPDHPDSSKVTPAMAAAWLGHVDCLRLLIDFGADVNWRSESQATPAMMAAAQGHLECLKALAEAGADLDRLDIKGRSAQDMARAQGHLDCAGYADSWSQAQKIKASAGRAAPLGAKSL